MCFNNRIGNERLMCWNISSASSTEYKGSCCPGANLRNLYFIGSKLGTVTSITLSTSASLLSASFIQQARVWCFRDFSVSIVPNSSSNQAHPSVNSHSLIPRLRQDPTTAIATGTSLGGIVLILASFLIYFRIRRRKRREVKQSSNVKVIGSKDVVKSSKEVRTCRSFQGYKNTNCQQEEEIRGRNCRGRLVTETEPGTNAGSV